MSNKLYKVSNQTKEKYKYKKSETHLVRYNKKFFELLCKGNNKYIELFSAFERGVEKWMSEALFYKPDTTLTLDSYRKGHWIVLNEREYHMHLNFLERVIIPHLKKPEENSKLMITTHNGGTHLAYYRNGQYEVPMASGNIRIEDQVVIDWRNY